MHSAAGKYQLVATPARGKAKKAKFTLDAMSVLYDRAMAPAAY